MSKTQNKRLDRFLFSYNGNKYRETKKHLAEYLKNDYDIIIEPFGGIFGFSRAYAETRLDNLKTKFFINDIDDKLINAFKTLKNLNGEDIIKFLKDNNINDDKTLKEYSDKNKQDEQNPFYDVINYSCRGMIASYRDYDKLIKKIKNWNEKKEEINKFLNQTSFYNNDFKYFMKEVEKNIKPTDRVLVFLDPPYFNTDNKEYQKFVLNNQELKETDIITDNTTIYIDIYNFILETNYKCLLIINKISILHFIFKDFYEKSYNIQYQNTYQKRGTKKIIDGTIKYGEFKKNKNEHSVYTN